MEALAAELLVRGRHEPGRPMEQLARALGHEVVHRPFRARVRGFCAPGTIFVSPSGYPPRNEFTIAHELLELHMPRELVDAVPDRLKEKLCDRGAAALMLPRGPFLEEAARHDAELPALRQRFRLVSYEVIATRLVDLCANVTASSWVQGERLWWRGPGKNTTDAVHITAERGALRLAHQRGRGDVDFEGVRGRAWRLTARGKRVALTLVQGTRS